MDHTEPDIRVERRTLQVVSGDGAGARVQLHLPPGARAAVYWLPALGVGIGPNEPFADAMAKSGIAVAVHEWRGLGESDRRASRRCDWGYRELFECDLLAGIDAARAALPDLHWHMGGHSLGGQLALIQAARQPNEFAGAFLVASGQPYWRGFTGLRRIAVLGMVALIPPITTLVGHFPGTRLKFAGREAGGLMRDWAGTAMRGDYRLRAYGDAFNAALADYAGRVLAIRMSQDWLAPPPAIDRLRVLTPRADWNVRDFGMEAFQKRRPDHFGWLREPAAVVSAFEAWRG